MIGNIITFYLGQAIFGIDIAAAKEVDRNVQYTPVPGTKPHIAGLMNLRGQVVTLFDIGRMMGYEYERKVAGSSCIILKTGTKCPEYAGFLVESLRDVLNIREDWCEPPPANLRGLEGKFIKEMVKLESGLIPIIDPHRIISEYMNLQKN